MSSRAPESKPAVVITGVSTGIGYATAEWLSRRGYQVFGSVRSQADAERTSRAFGGNYSALVFDVTDRPAIEAAAKNVSDRLSAGTLFALINNAGIEVPGPLAYVPVDRFRVQLEVNLVGVLNVIQAFLPLLGTDPNRKGWPGRIINISSVSGRLATPFVGAYCASKFGLEGLSDSLRRELLLFGIDVVLVEPGAVVTPMWEKAEGKVVADFPGTPYDNSLKRFAEIALKEGRNGFPAEKVAELIERILQARRPKARYALVPKHFMEYTVPRLLPTRLLDYLIGRYLGIGNQRARAGTGRNGASDRRP
jgi:NAD(P)-dependent dehydrogenase (short-subunit alcohol dehydrogenase family)